MTGVSTDVSTSVSTDDSMWATVFMAPGQLAFRKMPLPEVGPDDILVKIKTALTCGTDVKTYKRGHPKYDPPTLFGHEFAGDVVAVGGDVKDFEVGMRVVAGNTAPCNQCYFCKRGQPNLCDDLLVNLKLLLEETASGTANASPFAEDEAALTAMANRPGTARCA